MRDLKNKVAVVTGGSEGIGKEIARALVQSGAQVAIIARSPEKLDGCSEELGGRVKGFSANLTLPEEVRRVLADVEAHFGPIDILVNNVGGGTFKPLHEQTAAEAELPIGIPLTSAIVACHAVVPGMIKRGSGHILSLTSPAGYVPFPYMMPYVVTRHAMNGLALALRYELRDHGVGSTLFCPGQVDTGYFERNDADVDWYPRAAKLFPVLRPEEVAKRVVKAIRNNRREVIYPVRLWLFLRFYQKFPGLTVGLLSILGLWRPARGVG